MSKGNIRAGFKPPIGNTTSVPTDLTSDNQNRSAPRSDFYHAVAEILRAARANAYRAVNFAMVEAYWNVGRTIVEKSSAAKSARGTGRN